MPDNNFTILEVRLPQENEFTFESMSSLLANFTQFSKLSFVEKLIGKKKTIASLEIVLKDGQLRFYVVVPKNEIEFFRSQILAQYSSAITRETPDYIDTFFTPPSADSTPTPQLNATNTSFTN